MRRCGFDNKKIMELPLFGTNHKEICKYICVFREKVVLLQSETIKFYRVMAASQYNRYIWLVETIRRAGHISRADIDRKWADSRYNDNKESALPERTFFRYRNAIEELFGIDIKCDRVTGHYYIPDMENNRTKQLLLSQFAVSQSLEKSSDLIDRVIYEDIPGGTEFLSLIADAMRENRWLLATHQRFDSAESHVLYIAPFCLKVFKQRWYVFGAKREIGEHIAINAKTETRIYALDRMRNMEATDETFKLPRNFDPTAYFSHFYGVFCGPQYKPEHIRVRVAEKSAPFLRTLKLHSSQSEPEPCIFEWYVAPTFDFIQQLRTFGSELEVLAPKSLRAQFAEEAANLSALYK